MVHYNRGGVPNWRDFCIGICSAVQKGEGQIVKHLPILNYAGKSSLKAVRADVKRIQKENSLGAAWVYKTRDGFHVYFGTDLLKIDVYLDLVLKSGCCNSFKRYVANNNFGALRVSAKYTKFDIVLHEIIFTVGQEKASRRVLLATIAQEMLRLGQESGTHLASLFPQWAKYKEDQVPWTPKRVGRIGLDAPTVPTTTLPGINKNTSVVLPYQKMSFQIPMDIQNTFGLPATTISTGDTFFLQAQNFQIPTDITSTEPTPCICNNPSCTYNKKVPGYTSLSENLL
jgi:hypothetical protein